MLFENSNKKKKNVNDEALGYSSSDGGNQQGYETVAEDSISQPEINDFGAMKERTAGKLSYLTTPVDPTASEKRFKSSFGNYMLPKDTPERRKQQYSLSQSALDDVVGDYYNNELKGEFEQKREESKKRGRDEYMRYASVPGANPENAYRASLKADDPMNVVDDVMRNIDEDELLEKVTPLASYGGFAPKSYADNLVKPALRDKMVGEYVKENTPKSSGEYIARSALDNSLVGKISAMGVAGSAGKNHRAVASEGLAAYDSNRLENFAANVGSLLVDAPAFSAFGGMASAATGKMTSALSNRIAANVMSRSANKMMNKQIADDIARRVITQRLGSRILQSSSVQGLTLGGYDVANSVADDILYNGNIDLGKAAGSFGRGAALGGALGVVGTPLRKMSAGLTGGKKLLSSAGVLSAESAVFTAGGEIEKIAKGVEVAPFDLLYDFGESAATLLTMKMTHWRPQGVSLKLNKNGRLRNELQLTSSEKQELRELDVDPDNLMLAIERELRMPSLGSANAEQVKESYAKLMSNRKLSASAKSKLMYIVENKVTSTPPVVFDYSAEKKSDGTWKLEMLDMYGRIVERKDFFRADDVKDFLLSERGGLRRNRIAHYEKELTQGLESQNFLRQAGVYAKEWGIDANKLADAMYKSARKEPLSNTEQKMINEVLYRTAYNSPGMVQELYDARRSIEKKFGLEKGSLLSVVDKKFFNCSDVENKALDEYEAYVRGEVEMLKKGTDNERAIKMYDTGLSSMFFGYSNDDVKRYEVGEYKFNQARKNGAAAMQGGSYYKPVVKRLPKDIKPGYVVDGDGNSVAKDLVDNYRKRADELSKKFGFNLNYITDEREIGVPDRNNYDAVAEYNNQLNALGWQHKGKIFINLPNIKNYNDLETTVVHEAVAHGGFKKVFGYRLQDFLEEVYHRADKSVLEGLLRTKGRYRGADAYTVVEEYLAEVVEKEYPNARERNIITGFKDFIRNTLTGMKIYTGRNRRISEKELESLMRAHCRYVMNNKSAEAHRKGVFGGFDQANAGKDGYFDKDAYDGEMREQMSSDAYRNSTPGYILPYKTLLKYPYFSEENKSKIRERYGMSDEEIMSQVDGFNYRFIGEKGAENLRRSDWEEIPDLYRSKELERKGYGADYIKFAQGWERGADGEWRYEIAEKDMFLNDYMAETLEMHGSELGKAYKRLKEKPYSQWNVDDKKLWNSVYQATKPMMENVKLNDILQDFDLYEAYPEFANTPVKIVANAPYIARYDNKKKELLLDRRFFVMPDADAYIAGTVQNMIQDYEGFGKAISFRVAAAEKELEDNYKVAQNYLAVLNQDDFVPGKSGKKNLLKEMFRSEFGITPEQFKERFPTYNDYLFYKLTGKNLSVSGNVEIENVRKRFPMSHGARRMNMSSETEMVPRGRQIVVNSLHDLDKYFTGPLDVINSNLRKHYSDEPFIKDMKLTDDVDYTIPENAYRFFDNFPVYDDEKGGIRVPHDKQKEFRKKFNKWDKEDYDNDDKPKLLN